MVLFFPNHKTTTRRGRFGPRNLKHPKTTQKPTKNQPKTNQNPTKIRPKNLPKTTPTAHSPLELSEGLLKSSPFLSRAGLIKAAGSADGSSEKKCPGDSVRVASSGVHEQKYLYSLYIMIFKSLFLNIPKQQSLQPTWPPGSNPPTKKKNGDPILAFKKDYFLWLHKHPQKTPLWVLRQTFKAYWGIFFASLRRRSLEPFPKLEDHQPEVFDLGMAFTSTPWRVVRWWCLKVKEPPKKHPGTEVGGPKGLKPTGIGKMESFKIS